MSDLRDAILERAALSLKHGKKAQAESDFKLALTKSIEIGKKMDIIFELLNISLEKKEVQEIVGYVEDCKVLLEKGGDWERRNRLKIYESLEKLLVRDLKQACKLILEAIPTFNSSDIIQFDKLVDSDIVGHLNQLPAVKNFLFSFYRSEYSNFFKSLIPIIEMVSKDEYIGPHKKYFIREVRVSAYNQFLESYKTVSLASMSRSFGVSVEFLDRELSELIATRRINSRIDKISGMVESVSMDQRNKLYFQALRAGDHLLNRIQKLSRLIDI
ncbi:26S proteasome non-ATPase regulatory subunit 6-like [Hippocampus zosterae]|uniref:26S proteasome non-ATPase regulatory subunit 6-like n=1 Tax=Hippocampus zosterae TaxID=109293 RepID=UPI00223CCE71|nr:26S proteasome non-ATPase regulatory subunit 6-like [Hippocampus zosterae]